MKIVENAKLTPEERAYEAMAQKAVSQAQLENIQLVQEGRLAWGSDDRVTIPDNKDNSAPLSHLLNKIRTLTNSNPSLSAEIASVIAATLREAPSAPLSERLEFQHKIERIECLSRKQETIAR